MFDFDRHRARILTAGLFVSVGMLLGCEGRSPSAPGQSIPGQPTFSALTVKTIVPGQRSTRRRDGATLTIGGIATSVIVESSTSIIATTVAHASGTVDVIVKDRDGRSATLAGGIHLAPAGLFHRRP